MNIKFLLLFLLIGISCSLQGQNKSPYFVDGYHGGIYGHYPLWVTQFILDSLKTYPEWQVGLEIEPETWDTVKVKDPHGYASLQAWANSKRIDFTNPTYAQPYMYNISGESIIRQFSYGIAKQSEHFQGLIYTTYAVEEPCFTSCLPQILNQFGFKYAVLKCPNTCWGGYTRAYGGEVVNWIGSDGTSILTVPRYENEELEANSTWQTTAWANSFKYLESSYAAGIKNPVGMTYQDAGWKNGPWLGTGEHIKGNSKYITWTNYFDSIAPKKSKLNWHLTQEDILVNLMWGSQVLQKIGQQVRQAENKLIQAEKIAAMAHLESGYKVNQTYLDDAWRTLMMSQHHDSWIVPYNKLKNNLTWAETIQLWTANSLDKSNNILKEVNNHFATNKNNVQDTNWYVRVFNTQLSSRKEIIEIDLPDFFEKIDVLDNNKQIVKSNIQKSNGKNILQLEASVDGFGYNTYILVNSQSVVQKTQGGVTFDDLGNCIIENDMYKLVLQKDQGGIISSLVAKYLGNQEFSGNKGGFLFGEISGHFYDEEKFHSSKDNQVQFEVIHDNDLKKTVQIQGSINGHPFIQKLSLLHGQPQIDFDLQILWKENVGIGEYKQTHKSTDNRRAFTDDHYKLKILFPTNFTTEQVYKNAPFDVLESKLENTFFGQWDQIKNNVILNWVDVLDKSSNYGLAILTDHTSSYVHGENHPIGLTAQYSGLGLWEKQYNIKEPLHIKYAIIPHKGNWEEAQISQVNNHWNEPLLAVCHQDLSLSERIFFKKQDEPIELTAFYWDKDTIKARFFNASNKHDQFEITNSMPLYSLQEIKLNNEKVKDLSVITNNGKSSFKVGLKPFGITTIQLNK